MDQALRSHIAAQLTALTQHVMHQAHEEDSAAIILEYVNQLCLGAGGVAALHWRDDTSRALMKVLMAKHFDEGFVLGDKVRELAMGMGKD